VLTPRSRIACKKKQTELGYDTHVVAAGKVSAQFALPGSVRTEILCQ
jgi:NADH dehydrogenase FAD-containing subunit